MIERIARKSSEWDEDPGCWCSQVYGSEECSCHGKWSYICWDTTEKSSPRNQTGHPTFTDLSTEIFDLPLAVTRRSWWVVETHFWGGGEEAGRVVLFYLSWTGLLTDHGWNGRIISKSMSFRLTHKFFSHLVLSVNAKKKTESGKMVMRCTEIQIFFERLLFAIVQRFKADDNAIRIYLLFECLLS